MVPLIALALASSLTFAGEILVDGMAPMLLVDGEVVHLARTRLGYVVGDLAEGTHRVEVRNLFGRTVDDLEVEVPAHERVLVRYHGRRLTVTGTVALSGHESEKTEAEETSGASDSDGSGESRDDASGGESSDEQGAGEEGAGEEGAGEEGAGGTSASASYSAEGSGGFGAMEIRTVAGEDSTSFRADVAAEGVQVQVDMEAGSPAAPGAASSGPDRSRLSSASFTGLDPNHATLTIDGREVSFVAPWGAHVMPAMTPGRHDLVLSLQGAEAFRADFITQPGVHTACRIGVHPFEYETTCVPGGPPLTPAALSSATGKETSAASPGSTRITIQIADSSGGSEPAPSPATPLSSAALQDLIEAVEEATFSDDQVDVIRTAAAHNHFTCAQVATLLEPIDFDDARVEAVKAVHPRILDPENAHLLEASFDFSEHKTKVRALFQ